MFLNTIYPLNILAQKISKVAKLRQIWSHWVRRKKILLRTEALVDREDEKLFLFRFVVNIKQQKLFQEAF